MTATLEEQAPPPAPTSGWRDRLQPLVRDSGGWAVTLLVTLLAGLLRFIRLDQPATGLTSEGKVDSAGHIFDELYYACDAQNLLRYGVEKASKTGADFCTPGDGPAFVVHPPLGKWMIAVGEKLFGFNTFGWRFAAAVVGTLTVLLVVRIARRMTGSDLLGGLAGLLLALDGMHFVESRVATLDVFLTFWIVAAFGALVVDRDRIRSRLAEATEAQLARGGNLGRRPWLMLAGVCVGGALATKWSGLLALAPMVLLVLCWEFGARRTAGIRRPRLATLRRSTPALLVGFAAVPLAIYLLSWAGWFWTDDGYNRQWAADHGAWLPLFPDFLDPLRSWWHYHRDIWNFHSSLDAKHPYQSHPLSWPFLGRPVSYYYPPGVGLGRYGCSVQSCSREVLAIGNPAIWWAMVPACLGLVARWVARRDWRAGALALMIAVPVLAWIPSDLKGRTMFLFYALPAIPFLCIGLALLAGWALSRHRIAGAIGVGIYVSLVIFLFAFLYPVLAAVTLPYADWYDRMWFRSWI